MTDSVESGTLRASLVTSGAVWADVEHHATIDSTNARAVELARPWQVVVADHQSSGRGRMRRHWEAPPGTSVAVSATVPVPATGVGWIPLLTGLAVLGAIEETAGLQGTLKWPNDVLLEADDRRKVCGILCEVTAGIVVVGAGINITQTRDQLPVDTATSLRLAGAEVDRTALVVSCLQRFADLYAVLAAGGPAALGARTAYRDRCSTIGTEVRLSRPSGPDVVGRAVQVDDEGRLVIDQGGDRRAWAAGDVVHVRAPVTGGPDLA